MPDYTCPNPKFTGSNQSGQYSLAEIVAMLDDKESGFAEFFATKVKAANGGDRDAAHCVESYLYPTDDEMASFSIQESRWGSMRKCTDVGALVLIKCQENAPWVFQ